MVVIPSRGSGQHWKQTKVHISLEPSVRCSTGFRLTFKTYPRHPCGALKSVSWLQQNTPLKPSHHFSRGKPEKKIEKKCASIALKSPIRRSEQFSWLQRKKKVLEKNFKKSFFFFFRRVCPLLVVFVVFFSKTIFYTLSHLVKTPPAALDNTSQTTHSLHLYTLVHENHTALGQANRTIRAFLLHSSPQCAKNPKISPCAKLATGIMNIYLNLLFECLFYSISSFQRFEPPPGTGWQPNTMWKKVRLFRPRMISNALLGHHFDFKSSTCVTQI